MDQGRPTGQSKLSSFVNRSMYLVRNHDEYHDFIELTFGELNSLTAFEFLSRWWIYSENIYLSLGE